MRIRKSGRGKLDSSLKAESEFEWFAGFQQFIYFFYSSSQRNFADFCPKTATKALDRFRGHGLDWPKEYHRMRLKRPRPIFFSFRIGIEEKRSLHREARRRGISTGELVRSAALERLEEAPRMKKAPALPTNPEQVVA